MKLREIARLCGASHGLNEVWADFEPSAVTIDSRSIRPGELFVALAGEKTDGHEFVSQIFEKKAAAALVARDRLAFVTDLGDFAGRLLVVENTAQALQTLASRVIEQWNRPVIGITGSAGKTSIKEMTANVLSEAGSVLKSLGNLNTIYGLPLTVTRMITGGARPEEFDFAVLEMGMSSYGEIAKLVAIAPPQVGLIANVGTAHIEFFGSEDEIARAKFEMIEGIRRGGVAVLNADDRRVIAMRERRRDLTTLSFGLLAGADITARDVAETNDLSGTRFTLVTPSGEAKVNLPLIGRHNVSNALAAAAVGHYFALSAESIALRLETAIAPRMRGEVLRFLNGVTVIDDSYNSNPLALTEAVRAVAQADRFKRRIVVAGEMLELGTNAAEFHRASGSEIARAGIEIVLGVRGLARELVEAATGGGAEAVFCETPEAAFEQVIARARPGDVVLIKGSRGVHLERLVESLKSEYGERNAG